MPFTFYVKEKEITGTLGSILEQEKVETEQTIQIVYQPQAVFKVRSVTRCTSTIPGIIIDNQFCHKMSILKLLPQE